MKKIILVTSLIVLAVVIVTTSTVKANRSYFVPSVTTALATTSMDYMRATNSVLPLDAYTTSPTAINSATLLVQSIASTSAAVQTITIDYSQDGVDWFSIATTTKGYDLNNTKQTYTITGNTTASTTRVGITVATPVRYVRATVATSTALSSVWLQWVPIREMVQ